MFRPDLDAYCHRIQYSGLRTATLATLQGLVRCHAMSIPFENLDVMLGKPISVQPAEIEQKLVHQRRGGYCFEQNGLLLEVLIALGFDATPISARVHLSRTAAIPYRTHLFLEVRIEGERWLADVGVGALTPTQPLRLQVDELQPSTHETRRIVARGAWSGFSTRSPDATLFHQAERAGTWVDICDFTLEPMPFGDRVVANWFTSTHPRSHFRNQLMVALATDAGRITLNNRTLTRRHTSGTHTQELLDDDALLHALQHDFGMPLDVDLSWVAKQP